MRESNLLKRILLLGTGAVRLFRNNVGGFKDATGRFVRYGLCTGSSDAIGWKSIIITPEMVGQRVAVFVAIETKGERGVATPEQRAFIAVVQCNGGIAGIVRTEDEAKRLLDSLDAP